MIELPYSSCSKEEYWENRGDRLKPDDLMKDTVYTAMLAFDGSDIEALRLPARLEILETLEENLGHRLLSLVLLDEDLNTSAQAEGVITSCGLWTPKIIIHHSFQGFTDAHEGYLLDDADDIDKDLLELTLCANSLRKKDLQLV